MSQPKRPNLKRRDSLREIKLTPEGWVYLVVLVFIAVGAVLRNVNLLIFMAGMMVAPIMLNWRLAVSRMRSLSGSRFIPTKIHANDSSMVQWTCHNRQSKRLSAWNVVVNDSILPVNQADGQSNTTPAGPNLSRGEGWFSRWFGEITDRLSQKSGRDTRYNAKLGFPRINSEATEIESYCVFFACRGEYVIGPATISTTFPFGLIVSRFHIPEQETVFVAPELGHIHPTWEKRVESIASGADAIRRRRSIQRDEFYALRSWRSGDSKKNIHWRTTARMGQPIVKEHDQPNNRDFALVNDLYCPAGDQRAAELCELALSFTATAMLNMGSSVQGQVAVGVCGRKTEVCHSRSRYSIIPHLMTELAQAEPSEDPDVVDSIFAVAQRVSRLTPVYVVSSRERPAILEPDFDAQQLVEGSDFNGDANRLARRLRQIVPLIRWICVDSEEFETLFRLDPAKHDVSENISVPFPTLSEADLPFND